MFDNMSNIEFRGGVCGGTRWNIPATTPFGFSPCPNRETFDWDMKGILSKSIDVHENDACVILDDQVMDSSLHTMVGMGAMEDWRQTFNVHGGGGGGRTNHQSQEHTIMMSQRLSNTLHDTQHENSSSLQPFKPFSLEESNINNTTTQHDMTFVDAPNNISYGLSSELLQTLFEDDDEDLVHESIFENHLLPINYPCTNNSPPIPKRPFDPSSLISDQTPPLWNSSSVASLNDIRANNFFPKVTANKVASEVSRGPSWSSAAMKKNHCDRQPLKRSKIETPSSLPSFKVRKEKLGDRITALQQLVSPFGKTDTASVLHEAIDYIKFLHNQVNVLSRPYSKKGNDKNTTNESSYVVEEGDGVLTPQDLKSRGLCLVPLSSTIPVAIETTRAANFWTPNFGVGYRS